MGIEEQQYECNKDEDTCSDFQSFQKHEVRKTGERPCQYGQYGENSSDFSEQSPHGQKTFVGKKSVKPYTTPNSFQMHERKQNSGSLYVCQHYENSPISLYHITKDVRKYVGEKQLITEKLQKPYLILIPLKTSQWKANLCMQNLWGSIQYIQ